MSRLKTALKATAVQQLFELTAMLLSVVLIPIYLARLGQEGYGLFLTGVAWASYLMFSNGGLSPATVILTSQAWALGEREQVANTLRTARALTALAALFVLAVSFAFHMLLRQAAVAAALKLTHPDAPRLALVVGAQVAVSLVASPFYDVLTGVQRTQTVSVIQGTVRLATQLLALGLLLAAQPVWVVFSATAVCMAFGGIAAFAVVRRADGELLRSGDWLGRAEVVRQLRTGAKSFGMQIGATLVGTAPILALQAAGGPALVPFYAVPNRIVSFASSALFNLSAYMQPAVGDAWARRDLPWLRDTSRLLIRQTVVVFVGISAVMISMGPEFIAAWTGDRLQISRLMVAGLLVAATCLGLVTTMKFILSGMNRHRTAAAGELVSGALAMMGCYLFARFVTPDAVAFGVAVGAACTSLLIMPRELRRYLEAPSLLPTLRQWIMVAVLGAVVLSAALGLLRVVGALGAPKAAVALVSGGVSALLFAGLCQATGLFDLMGPLRRALSKRSAA